MSSNTDEAAEEVCASCGITGGDDVKLKICTACKLVKYCSVDCQKNHRKQHKKACKKRAAEIRDDRLFTQPDESYLGECPICCLPNPSDEIKTTIMTCCSKVVCNGCVHANDKRALDGGLENRCLYCREPVARSQEEALRNMMERVKANDPNALLQMGGKCNREGHYEGAFQYYRKAAQLGDIEAHYNLSVMYREGHGVEKDKKKAVYHAEEAAIGGHPYARFNLAVYEGREAGRYDRAMKHFIIAAKLGDDDALAEVKSNFRRGFVSKEDYEAALRGHQSAVDATKSEQRDAAEKYYQRNYLE